MVDDERIHAVAGRPTGVGGPIGRGEVIVLLQGPASRILPINRHGAAGMADVKPGGADGLRHADERPDTAGEGIIAAVHGRTGIRLAKRAGELISSTGARTASTSDLMPVNVLLGSDRPKDQHQDCSDQGFHGG